MLQDNRIYLRAPEPHDIDFIFRIENDSSLWKYSQTISPYSKHSLIQFIRNGNGDIYQTKQLRFMVVLKETEKPVGMVDLYDFDNFNSKCAIGIVIDKENQNQGYAYSTLKLTLEYCFTYLSLNMLYPYIPLDNIKSLKLFRNVGFSCSAELKEWFRFNKRYYNVYLMQILSEE